MSLQNFLLKTNKEMTMNTTQRGDNFEAKIYKLLDEQKCNITNYYNITDNLKRKYKVSRSVVKIRLKKLGLLNEANMKAKAIRSILGY